MILSSDVFLFFFILIFFVFSILICTFAKLIIKLDMMQENIPVKVGLMELLYGSTGVQYVIPAYQRNYTWTANREVKQLMEDISSILSGERTKHFLGIMIYLETSFSAFQRERSVIDGQQRLTTIFLLMYALKELMLQKDMADDAEKLEKMYLVNQFGESNKYKLKPLVSDDKVYQQIVTREFDFITDKKSNVYLNFCYIREGLSKMLEKYTVTEILDAINKLYIVCVPIGKDDYPQNIFESINATGAKLTASDLIRNYILMPINTDLQEKYYEKYWKRLELLVSSDSRKLESFFRFFIMAKRQSLVNKSNVYRSFTEWFRASSAEYGVEKIFKEIVRYAGYYNALYKAPVISQDKVLQKPLEEFRFILSDMPAPLLMELYALYDPKLSNGKNHITAEQLGAILSILNSYLMRRALCGMDTSDITRYFPLLLKETMADCDGSYKNIVEIFKKNLVNRNKGTAQEMPDDNRLRDRIQNANMYSLRTWVSIFFRKLEMDNNPAPVDFSHLSIEHLMPQTATMEWYEKLAVDKETYDSNVHRLGNLTLASKSDNSKMSNKVWEYKNKILASTGHLRINQEILEKEHWLIGDIENRTQKLILKIASLYPYYEAKESLISKVAIRIDSDKVSARGYYYPDNGSVEILAGSELCTSVSNPALYEDVELLRNELLESGVIAEEGANIVFKTNYFVYSKRTNGTALSTAACIILHGSHNGWERWRTEDGIQIGQIKELRKNKE